jgi:hypothetical protein
VDPGIERTQRQAMKLASCLLACSVRLFDGRAGSKLQVAVSGIRIGTHDVGLLDERLSFAPRQALELTGP